VLVSEFRPIKPFPSYPTLSKAIPAIFWEKKIVFFYFEGNSTEVARLHQRFRRGAFAGQKQKPAEG
jgi:hypothetical protein